MRLEDFLQQHESETLDFKRDLSGIDGIVKTVCAFANTVGGTVVIGVEDDRTVVGIEDPAGEEERLINVLSDRLEPRPTVQVRGASLGDLDVLLVSTAFQAGPIHLKGKSLEEGTYGRYGSSSRVVDAGRLAELRRYRESRSWDELPCPGAVRDDLDEDLAERIFTERGIEFSESTLRTCRMLVDQGGELVPSNGGIVLFDRDRAKHYPDDARWRCIRYPGRTKSSNAVDPRDFESATVLEALALVESYISEHAGTVRTIEGLDRNDLPAFSDRVVREVLVNAIAHANYEVIGSRLDVSVYADRVEVQSPGTWPPGFRVEDLKDGVSQVRNRAIARTLRTLRHMEEQGTAWARVQEAVAEGYPEPLWEPHGPVLRVVVPKHELVSSQLSQETSGTNGTNRTNGTSGTADRRGARRRDRREKLLAILREARPEDVAVATLPEVLAVGRTTLYGDVAALLEAGATRETTRGRITIAG